MRWNTLSPPHVVDARRLRSCRQQFVQGKLAELLLSEVLRHRTAASRSCEGPIESEWLCGLEAELRVRWLRACNCSCDGDLEQV